MATKVDIENFANNNADVIDSFFNKVDSIVDGRICHRTIILLHIICSLEPIRNYMEIGTHNGGSMSMVAANPSVEHAVGIDLFENVYDETKHYDTNRYKLYSYFRRDNLSLQKTIKNIDAVKAHFGSNTETEFIVGNSFFDETEKSVSDLEKEFDLIFIDGDHTYEGVRNDFQRYKKFLSPHGYILFDDYHHPDVKRFVDSIEETEFTRIIVFGTKNSGATQALLKSN